MKDMIEQERNKANKQSLRPCFYSDCHYYLVESLLRAPIRYLGSFFYITDSGWLPDAKAFVASLPPLTVITFFPPGWLSTIFVKLYTPSFITTQRSPELSWWPIDYHAKADALSYLLSLLLLYAWSTTMLFIFLLFFLPPY